mmetsp:Transcript_70601/g.163190  ORF Transcript_70601/g.163190 Transcript_70601/m.163190 type:complete len:194 (+) Transcript_70601:111-692(+)
MEGVLPVKDADVRAVFEELGRQPNEAEVPLPCWTSRPYLLDRRRRPLRPIPEHTTTLVVRNIPRMLTQEDLLKEWAHPRTFDYLHIPYNFASRRPLGYVYINFPSPTSVLGFQDRWHGRFLAQHESSKPLDVAVAHAQGLDANLGYLTPRKAMLLKKVGFLPVVFDGARRLDGAAVMERSLRQPEQGDEQTSL